MIQYDEGLVVSFGEWQRLPRWIQIHYPFPAGSIHIRMSLSALNELSKLHTNKPISAHEIFAESRRFPN